MKTIVTLVIATLLVQVVWFVLPQFEYRWLSEDAIVLLSYAGLESSLGLEAWMSWAFLVATIIITAGLLFFGAKWRLLFVAYITFGVLVMVPLSGMNVETGLSMALRDVLNMLVGALIVIIFLPRKVIDIGH